VCHREVRNECVVVVRSVPLRYIRFSLFLSLLHPFFKIFVQIEEPIYRSFGAAILHFRPVDFILHLVHQRG
jgi:hypothetical protein